MGPEAVRDRVILAVWELFRSLRELAGDRFAEVVQMTRDCCDFRVDLDPGDRTELPASANFGGVMVLDVRPGEEYEAGHIPGANSVPLDDLEERLASLPRDAEIVVYCRGPCCVLVLQALEILYKRGFRARHLDDGRSEWRQDGLPVAVGTGDES